MEKVEYEGVTYIYDPNGENYNFQIDFKFDFSKSEIENQDDCGGSVSSFGDDMKGEFILPGSLVHVAKGKNTEHRKLGGGLDWLSVDSLDNDELRTTFEKNGVNEATILAIKSKFEKCLQKCRTLRGTKVTFEQFKTYIETGRLFATEEERKQFEESVREKHETKAQKEGRRDAIQEEIGVAELKLKEHLRKIESSSIENIKNFQQEDREL